MLDVKFIPYPRIDQLMETEIAKSKLWPQADGNLFDIETFLTRHLKADLDQDAFLEEGVMGEVEFRRGKKTSVKINNDLTVQKENASAAWQIGRWRMTVAHESAHVILHGPLFLSQELQDDFWGDKACHVHRCYKKQNQFENPDAEAQLIAQRYGWNSGCLINDSKARQDMEIQANRAAAALLMPSGMFLPLAIELFRAANEQNGHLTVEARHNLAASQLAERFGVSSQAAHIRCKDLEVSQHAGQLTLF